MTHPQGPARSGGHHVTRRAVLLQGLGVLIAIFVVGMVVSKPFMERSLKNDGERALEAQGIAAHLDFTFQDGRLLCADKIDDVDAAIAVVEGVRGVRSVSVDGVCVNGLTPVTTVPAPTTQPVTSPPPTTPPTTAATTTAPSTTAAATTTTVSAQRVSASYADGVVTLSGPVTQEQRDGLFAAATAVIDPTNVTDRLTIDDAAGLGDDDQSSLATLIGAMVTPMANAEVGWDGTSLYAKGEYVDVAAAAPFRDAATAAGITADLTERPAAKAADVSAVDEAMNEIVTATPLPFGKGQTTLGPEAEGELQRLAGIAKRFGGLSIEVQGHTDSEGDAGRNLTLSERRAQAVADALVRLGVPRDDVTFRGFGETDLIRDENGVELPDQSRRVVFGVTLR